MADPKQGKLVAVRMSAEDQRILRELHNKTGVRSQSEIVRMSLRSLAKQHLEPKK